MKSSQYDIHFGLGSLFHLAGRNWLVQDVDEPLEREQLRAHVMSGDYFGMLATELDEISQYIIDTNEQQSVMLQHAINDILLLERDYQIIPK